MTIFLSILAIIIIVFFVVITILLIKTNKENYTKTQEYLQEILDLKNFNAVNKIIVGNHAYAINKNYSMLAVIKNIDVKHLENCEYDIIATSFITEITKKGQTILLNYTKHGENATLRIYPAKKRVNDFFYELSKEINLKRIEYKFPNSNFSIVSSSDWECNYIWAYDPAKTTFAYFKTKDRQGIFKLDLKREHFTIDTKYKYLEAPVMGIAQQLFIFEESFLYELYASMMITIKHRTNTILPGKIFYDSHNNIVYLSNGTTSVQSIILDKIEEVYYRENRLSFSLLDDEKTINFMADSETIQEFSEFITTYNLRKIAQNFDYQTDKLINATDNTKLIIDYTRDRLVYCANLDTLSKFSYIIIPYSDLEDAKSEKSSQKNFVRIYAKNEEIIDVTCKKYEVAQYIMAQIKLITQNK